MFRMKTTRLAPLSLALLSLAVVACGGTPTVDPGDTPSSQAAASSVTTDEPLQPITVDRASRDSVAAAVLESFARRDWQTLSELAADTGVRFTPYTHVHPEADQMLQPLELAMFDSDQAVRTWGNEAGSGFPIQLTNEQYMQRYIWDHDYRTAPQVFWNTKLDRGGMIDNAQEVYPGASVVEYHFPGFDPQYGGMDWRSLRLVLAQNDDAEWTLYGVIHDEWTP